MAIPLKMADLSTVSASNSPAGSEAPISTDDFHRAIQAILRTTNAKGSDIASASTTDIGAATAEFVDVTGTTTITGLGTIAAGIVRTVRFTGILTLTHNATRLILPGAANITTAANDTAEFRSLGSGNWICVGYKLQSGEALGAFTDTNPVVKGSSDATKLARFEVDGLTTATTRVYTLQDADGTLAHVNSQTFTGTPTLPTGTIATTQATSDNSTKLATTAFVQANILLGGVGAGQTWQDLTASRARNTDYTNSTGRAIMVVAACLGAGSNKFFKVDGTNVGQACNDSSFAAATTFIVPAGGVYRLDSTTATSISWSELR